MEEAIIKKDYKTCPANPSRRQRQPQRPVSEPIEVHESAIRKYSLSSDLPENPLLHPDEKYGSTVPSCISKPPEGSISHKSTVEPNLHPVATPLASTTISAAPTVSIKHPPSQQVSKQPSPSQQLSCRLPPVQSSLGGGSHQPGGVSTGGGSSYKQPGAASTGGGSSYKQPGAASTGGGSSYKTGGASTAGGTTASIISPFTVPVIPSRPRSVAGDSVHGTVNTSAGAGGAWGGSCKESKTTTATAATVATAGGKMTGNNSVEVAAVTLTGGPEDHPIHHITHLLCNMVCTIRDPVAEYQEKKGVPKTQIINFLDLLRMLFSNSQSAALTIFTMLCNLTPLMDGFLYVLRFVLDKTLYVCHAETPTERVLRGTVFMGELCVLTVVNFLIATLLVLPVAHLVMYICGNAMGFVSVPV